MTQELELYPAVEASRDEREARMRSGQQIEKEFADKIPEQFHKQIADGETEIQNADLVFLNVFDKHIKIAYKTLRDAEIPPASAKEIVVGRFIKYRSEGVIRRYLPDEPKNKGRQKGANASNVKQEETKNKIAEEAIERNLPTNVEEYIKKTSAESGHEGGMTTVIRHTREHMRAIGSKGGSAPRTPKETEDLAAKLAIVQYQEEHADEIAPSAEIKEVTIKLVSPDSDTEESRFALKIEHLWEKYGAAYITVDLEGKIQKVFNADERIKKMEEPITNNHTN